MMYTKEERTLNQVFFNLGEWEKIGDKPPPFYENKRKRAEATTHTRKEEKEAKEAKCRVGCYQ